MVLLRQWLGSAEEWLYEVHDRLAVIDDIISLPISPIPAVREPRPPEIIQIPERPFVEAPDPYVVGRPVDGQMFVGRNDVFKMVNDTLGPAAGKNILVLRGQRRTGKTSVLLRLRETLAKDTVLGYLPVFIDVQAMAIVQNEGQFFHYLAHHIASDLQSHQVQVALPARASFEQAPVIAFELEFLNQLQAALGKRRILLMLDEFEKLNELIDRRRVSTAVLDYLRHLMQHTPFLFLIAGTQKLREMTGGYWSVFFNLAVPIDIGTLNESETRWLITNPVRSWYSFDSAAVNEIVQVTGCHPYFTQLVCKKLVEVRNALRLNRVGVVHVRQAVDKALQSGEEQIGYPWTEEDCTAAERFVIAILAQECLEEPAAPAHEILGHLEDARVNIPFAESVSRLQYRGVVDQDEEGNLSFIVPLFQTWLARKGYDTVRSTEQYNSTRTPLVH